MAVLQPNLDPDPDHAARVLNAVQSSRAAVSAVAASWCRSALHHGLDPAAPRSVAERLGGAELKALRAGNGDVVAISGEGARKVDEAPHGRLYQDGSLLVNALEKTIQERRRLSFAGMVSVAVAVDEKGGIAGEPEIAILGLPPRTQDGTDFDEYVADTVAELLDGIPKARRRDPEALRNALERGVRSAVNEEWGKKPLVHALVIEV